MVPPVINGPFHVRSYVIALVNRISLIVASRRGLLAAAAVLFAVLACRDSTAPPVTATLTAVAATNNQRGIAGFALSIPLAVRVTNSTGQPLSGVTVTWEVISGGGTVSPTTSVTNNDGVAETRWTLGTTEGTQTVKATGNGTSTTFSATATSQTLTLNANAKDACTVADNRQGRVVAVSTNAIAVEDMANPQGQFSQADYQEILAEYERVIHPVGVLNFGQPTDIDANGRSIIFFTVAVNDLTPDNSAGTTGFVAGFFFARDLFPREDTPRLGACGTSNVAEMFYMLAPDANGVHGNKFDGAFVKRITFGTIAHELQHLINSARRLYVNTTARWPEKTWVEEGLSHIAEELVFYEASGLGPRQNIDLQRARSSQQTVDAINRYMVANFGRFRAYVQKTAAQSPYDADDDLETRGATWSFFRYAADRPGPSTHAACGATIDLSAGGLCLAAPDRAASMQISGGSTGAEFVAIPYFDANFSGASVNVTATASGATAAVGPPNPSLSPLFSSTVSGSTLQPMPNHTRLMPNLAFERQLRSLERRALPHRVAAARAWHAAKVSRTSSSPGFNATLVPRFATLVDGDVWMRLANGPDTGVTNVRAVFGTGVNDQLRAWAAAHYTDDAVTTGNAALQHPSWNFRSLLPALRDPPEPYPLATLTLTDATPQTFTLVDGGAAYLRFGVVAGTSATVQLTSGGGTLPTGASVWVVRTK